MNKWIILACVGTLTACATPKEKCDAEVTQNMVGLQQAIALAEANLARGYAVETNVEPRFRYGFCLGGDNIRGCYKTDYRKTETPVAIDLNEERRKLDSAKARLAKEQARANAGLAQCAKLYPEG